MKNEDYEKLGWFYLGRDYDQEKRERTRRTFLYDSKQLTTHAVCVGMTGSGKTGLCVTLLEEAAIDGIPVIAIDPKGDVGNLLLGFPELRGSDFLPWIDVDEAARQGVSPAEFADRTAETWKNGLADWDQTGARIKLLQDAVDMAIYTPGSSAGLPVTVLRSFNAPPQSLIDDAETYRDRIASAVSGLLALLGIDADPISSREHILLSNLLDHAWRNGRDLDLPGLIHAVQSPPFEKVGVIDRETFYPAKDRFALALKMNNLIASPGFAGWMQGEPLDVPSLLYTAEGKPRVSIMSIAHLDDAERMFFVTILLNEVLAWARSQSGTSSLRAVLYMDEIYGYFPPSAAPPSKKPMLTLLKQARAFGLGVVLATQNPVDLDYKGLSNAGAWFLGRLQTRRDKDRVLDGLEGVSNAAGSKFDRKRMDETLSALGKRVFVLNNVHEDHPIVFETRWALSYLRGPLTREQIQTLTASRKEAPTPAPEPPRQNAAATQPPPPVETRPEPSPTQGATQRRPVLPPGVPEVFLPRATASNPSASLVYRPALLGVARLHYVDRKANVDYWETLALLRPIADAAPDDVWEGGKQLAGQVPDLAESPEAGASFAPLPGPMARAKSYADWTKTLKNHLYRERKLTLWSCPELKAYGRPEETARDLRLRLTQAVREQRDAEIETLRAKFGPRRTTLERQMRQARERLEAEQAQASRSTWDAAVSLGTSVLDAFTGRKTWTKTNVGKAGAAAKAAGRALQKRGEAVSAQTEVDRLNEQYVDLETEFQAELELIKATRTADLLKIVPLELTPRKADISVERVVLAWTPWMADVDGSSEAAYQPI